MLTAAPAACLATSPKLSATIRVCLATLATVTLSAPRLAPAQESAAAETTATTRFRDRFVDPEDGRLDVTAHGEGGSGFLPVPIPFNEPAIGVGLVLAGVYFHPTDATNPVSPNESQSPPSTTFGGVAYSDNGSWAAAGGHAATLRDGRIRYLGGLGTASAGLRFYGVAGSDGADPDGLDFTFDGDVLVQQAQFRIAGSPFAAGMRYTLLLADVAFDIVPESSLALDTSREAGITVFVNYDDRDNSYTPNEGTYARLSVGRYSESLGGDFDYSRLGLTLRQYWPLADERLVLGMRADYQQSGDGAPFYSLPWVSLRGVPALRYLGENVMTLELEPRWKLDERWSLVAFAGAGRAADSIDELDSAERAYSYGIGFRYLIARRLGLAVGLDLAQGPDDSILAITVGNAWGF